MVIGNPPINITSMVRHQGLKGNVPIDYPWGWTWALAQAVEDIKDGEAWVIL